MKNKTRLKKWFQKNEVIRGIELTNGGYVLGTDKQINDYLELLYWEHGNHPGFVNLGPEDLMHKSDLFFDCACEFLWE